MRNFHARTPEDFDKSARMAFDLAIELGQRMGRKDEPGDRAALTISATLNAGTAAILDRLERILLLLDERLPARDPLEGTVER